MPDSRSQVLAPVGVEQAHAFAAHERHRQAAVGLQHVARFARLNLVERRHGHRSLLTWFPSSTRRAAWPPPSSVRGAASSSAARSRPSTITTSSTPAASACSHARSFAIMPAVAVPSRHDAARSPAASSVGIVVPAPSSTPGVVPAMTRRRAPSRAARWPANVSAFTLSSRPSRADADARDDRHESGAEQRLEHPHVGAIRPARRRSCRSTRRPSTRLVRRRLRRTARTARPRRSARPPATPAAFSAATSRVFTAPASTETTTSSVARVGDAQPVDLPLLDPGGLQRGVDLLAAAVHDDERRPGGRDRRDRRHDRRPAARGSSISSPPNFRTTGAAVTAAPSRSSRPSMTFRFCTAWPAAPFTRLSMTETRTARPDGSTRQPMSQKFVCATCLISGSADAGEAHERRAGVRPLVDVAERLARWCRAPRARRSSRGCRGRAARGAARRSARATRHALLDLGGVAVVEHAVRRHAAVALREVRPLGRRLARARHARLRVDDDVGVRDEEAGVGERREREQRRRRVAARVGDEPRARATRARSRSVRP